MGWLCVGMEQPVERLELERARISISQTVKEVHLSKTEKKCVWFLMVDSTATVFFSGNDLWL